MHSVHIDSLQNIDILKNIADSRHVIDIDEFRKILELNNVIPNGPIWQRIWSLNPQLRDDMKKYGKYYKMKNNNPNNKKIIDIENEVYDSDGNLLILKYKFDFLEPLIRFIKGLKETILDKPPNYVAKVGFRLEYLEESKEKNVYMRLTSTIQNMIIIVDSENLFPIKPVWTQHAIERGFIIYKFKIDDEEKNDEENEMQHMFC